MKRWAAVIVVLGLAVAAGGAFWRASQLDGNLDEARAEIAALRERSSAETAAGDEKDDRLEALAADVKDLVRELRQTRRRLYDRQGCPGMPRLILSPSSGPPGTRVDFVGYCFVGEYWGAVADGRSADVLTAGYGLFIMNPAQDLGDPNYVSNGGPDCELIGATNPEDIVIRRDGTARGYLTIPSSGGCFQEDRSEAVSPGEYHIGLGCHTCSPLATFRVTP